VYVRELLKYSAPPDPLAGFRGPLCGGGRGWGKEGRGEEGEVEGV